MPSKILAMMASQRPSLITGNLKSEVASIISRSNAGKYIDATNTKEILDYVITLKENKENKEIGKENGIHARNFVSLNYSKKEVLKQFKNTFISLIK
jgi:colanic acid biosynthesis glycosyl transferase WcaI